MNVHEHSGRLTDKQVGVLLILPGLAVFAAIILYPFVNAILMSFTNRSLLFPEYNWIQLENYKKVFTDPYFTKTLVTTALFVLGSTIFPYTLGLLWAIVLNQGFKGAEFMRGVTLVNWIIPGTAIGFLWSWIFNGLDRQGLHCYVSLLPAPGRCCLGTWPSSWADCKVFRETKSKQLMWMAQTI